MLSLASIFLLLVTRSCAQNNVTVDEVISQREQLVREIAARAEELYQNRYNEVQYCECARHDCANDFGPDPQMECTTHLIFDTCEDECGSRLVSYNKSGIRTPYATNPSVLSDVLKSSICTFTRLEESFLKVKSEYGLLNSWTYFGARDGHFQLWPLRARSADPENKDPYLDGCKGYDPRRRPWYNAASTGPKDVILLVDRSQSTTGNSGRVSGGSSLWDLLQRAMLSILDTFIYADYINVVLYSGESEALWTESPLVSANPENRKNLSERVRRATPSGSTNIEVGFETAIDLFIKARKEGYSSNCSQVILFLTEGRDTRRKTSEVVEKIELLQQQLEEETGNRATVFVYSVGPESDVSTSKQIACANNGLWSYIRNYEDPLADLNNYLETMATTRGFQGPIWVDPYEDAGGLGILTTVSMPVFNKGEKGELPILVGVVGHDVILDDLVVNGSTAEAVLSNLVTRSKECQPLALSSCDLQVERYIVRPDNQCADVYPESVCYKFEDRWYRRYSISNNQHSADAFCKNLGGSLSPIRSSDHLRFLAAIASADKSWIGGMRVIGVDPIQFKFEGFDLQPITQYNEAWAENNPGDLREMCIALDRRSTTGNLESMFCETPLDFICEFPDDLNCENSVTETTDAEGKLLTFAQPYPEECPGFERFVNDTLPIPQASNLDSSEVICDFGLPVSREELYCCIDCINDTISTLSSSHIHHSLSAGILFVTLGFILYVI